MDLETGPEMGQNKPLTPAGDRDQSTLADDREPARDDSDTLARPALAKLTADPRMPVWIRRGIAAAVAGIAIGIWLGWRAGVTAAGVVAIADTIYRSRTMAGVPEAAQVTAAQRRTGRRLARLRRSGYVTLNARAIPGSDEVIDHLVIGPGGVIALDSEAWDRRLPVRAWTNTQLYLGPFNQKARLTHAKWEARQASMLLSAELGRDIEVRAAMAVYGPTIPWTVANLRGVDVFGGGRLGKYLKRLTKASRRSGLAASQIEAIRAAAEKLLPPA